MTIYQIKAFYHPFRDIYARRKEDLRPALEAMQQRYLVMLVQGCITDIDQILDTCEETDVATLDLDFGGSYHAGDHHSFEITRDFIGSLGLRSAADFSSWQSIIRQRRYGNLSRIPCAQGMRPSDYLVPEDVYLAIKNKRLPFIEQAALSALGS
ncbi:hypothetical protein ACFL0V_01960 [Nanoarchaeota archaeon]